jgi:hypothetical protein
LEIRKSGSGSSDSITPIKTLLLRLASGESVPDDEIEEISKESGLDAIALIAVKNHLAPN